MNGPQPPYKDGVPEQYYKPSDPVQLPERKANATFVMLVRNSDGPNIMNSMKQIEDRFNRKFQYPYVFLNDQPFTENFKKSVSHGLSVTYIKPFHFRYISQLTDAPVEFGLIPSDHWKQPDWIDEAKATAAREDMMKNNVIYGGM